MVASGDVTVAEDSCQGNVKLHPYLVALVRWCVSCVWSTATLILHRLMTSSLPLPIAGTKPAKRPAGKDHLHPEPKVECVVLHQPSIHKLDVIFVHGLYGSLGNTWKQGEWSSKYTPGPKKIHLRRPRSSPAPCSCIQCYKQAEKDKFDTENEAENKNSDNKSNNNARNKFNDYKNANITNIDESFYSNIKTIMPNDEDFITEKFYKNTLLNQINIVDNYETQAQFVSDLFKNNCDNVCDGKENKFNRNNDGNTVYKNRRSERDVGECQCKKLKKQCEVGCGCICDECYSPCWPRDWIKEDYPDARIISINYTSDPYLWRPLWIKESKRLHLHERAEQMTHQLLGLGVGSRPLVWVGHSKGGLFIKQIYCEAYEAYLKTKLEDPQLVTEENSTADYAVDNEINTTKDLNKHINNSHKENRSNDKTYDGNENNNNRIHNVVTIEEIDVKNFSNIEDKNQLVKRTSLYLNSVGFMLYSVPHRGSPLADIKTPITARSVELREISKDCSLVMSLQARWLVAASRRRPVVRSLVETRRTLMSLLWLRIVSADSADAGIGALCGVAVDHREICKPASRRCLLYTELTALIDAALQSHHQN